jgi:hypothetical protein
MWTIDDIALHERLRQPLVPRDQPRATEQPGNCVPGVHFPWQVPFPNDHEWQLFLSALLNELRDKPEAKQAFFNAIERLAGVAPNGGPR